MVTAVEDSLRVGDFTLAGWSPGTDASTAGSRRTRRLALVYWLLGGGTAVLAAGLVVGTWVEPESWPPILVLGGLALISQYFPVHVSYANVSLGVGFLLAACLTTGPAVAATVVAAVILVWSLTRELAPWFSYARNASLSSRLAGTLYKSAVAGLVYYAASALCFAAYRIRPPVTRVTPETLGASIVLTVGVYLLHNLASLLVSYLVGDDVRGNLRTPIPAPALAEFLGLPAAVLLVVTRQQLGWAAFALLAWLYLMAAFLGWRSWQDREALKRRLDDVELLHHAGSTLGGTLEIADLVRRLHGILKEVVSFQSMLLLVHDPAERLSHDFAFDSAGGRGDVTQELKDDTEARPEGVYAEDAGASIFTRNLVRETLDPVRGGTASVRLRLDFAAGDKPSPHRLVLLETVCQQAGAALNNARLYRLANTDRLTGLAIRRYFERALRLTAARGEPFAVIMLDLDGFKQTNDSYGHDAGDEVLRDLAVVLSGSLRAMDTGARWGGEEFVILLPGSGSPEAAAVAERIRRSLEQRRVAWENREIRYAASFGVAASTEVEPGLDPMGVVWKADEALMVAKRHGRNQVVTLASLGLNPE